MKLTLARVARAVIILAALAAFTIAPTAGAAEGGLARCLAERVGKALARRAQWDSPTMNIVAG